MRGSTHITASDTTNRVSLSPDHTRTAPIGTKGEQNREPTRTTQVQKRILWRVEEQLCHF